MCAPDILMSTNVSLAFLYQLLRYLAGDGTVGTVRVACASADDTEKVAQYLATRFSLGEAAKGGVVVQGQGRTVKGGVVQQQGEVCVTSFFLNMLRSCEKRGNVVNHVRYGPSESGNETETQDKVNVLVAQQHDAADMEQWQMLQEEIEGVLCASSL